MGKSIKSTTPESGEISHVTISNKWSLSGVGVGKRKKKNRVKKAVKKSRLTRCGVLEGPTTAGPTGKSKAQGKSRKEGKSLRSREPHRS